MGSGAGRSGRVRSSTIKIALFGIGAMGCLFGARLSPLADVTLVGRWPDQLRMLRESPLRIIHPDGHEESVWLHATDDLAALGPVPIALILTKAGKTAAAAQDAAQVLAPDGLAVTLQNGLGNLETLAQYVGPERAALGVTTQGAALDGPGVLRLGGAGTTTLAVRPAIAAQVGALVDLLARAGMPAEVADDVSGLVWGKLAVNAAINPLTALLRVPNGALLDSAWARRIMARAANEVAAVAAAQGIVLPFPDAAAMAEQVARATAANRSSMLQDVARGAETEIEAICGEVVRIGARLGVPTPTNAVLYELVKALEQTSG